MSEKEPIGKKFERFISKLKVVKQPKETNVMVEVENPVDTLETSKLRDITNENDVDSPKTFKVFCQEVEKFMNFVNNNEDLSYYIYKYPRNLQKQINVSVDELRDLLAEISEATMNIKKLKNQRNLIKRESSALQTTIRRVKNNEIKELESILAQCDKDMFNHWIKAKWKIDAMEDLMFDAQEKQIALESLIKLIDRCTMRVKENSFVEDEWEDDHKSVISLSPSTISLESKIPTPPPIPSSLPRPIPLTVSNLNRNNSRLSWAQRRFRAEKRGNYVPIRLATNSDNRENEPLVFTFNVSSNNASGSGINFNASTLEFNSSRFSSNSNETISSSGSNNQRRVEDDFEIKVDVHPVIYGDRNRTSMLIVTESNDSFNSNAIPEESNNSNCS